MGWIEGKSVGFILPVFADELVGREACERLQSLGEVVGGDEIAEVHPSQRVWGAPISPLLVTFFGVLHALLFYGHIGEFMRVEDLAAFQTLDKFSIFLEPPSLVSLSAL